MANLIGRKSERKLIESYIKSDSSEFVMVYGRRRVGKTFLIREHFNNNFEFYFTGMANATSKLQLQNFHLAFQKYSKNEKIAPPKNWLSAFNQLSTYLEKSRKRKKVIFLDELPWMDSPKSDFITALEHFWNSWAAARTDIVLIVCGSSTSWMINKLINNKGGLHNRITRKLYIRPFTLNECEEYLQAANIPWNRYQIAESYMVLGGIPYYLSLLEKGKSLAQNIDILFFSQKALLANEFENLYAALFKHSENHIAIVEALSKKTKGLTRDEIIRESKLPNGGGLSKVLDELESCEFIRKYIPFGKKSRESLYQLCDFYSLFYFQFVKGHKVSDENYWANSIDSPKHRAWAGYAFEQICMMHSPQIKQQLGISGIKTEISSWKSKELETGAQIDMLIDRNDQVINLLEMKYSINEFTIDKAYAANLRNKIACFRAETKTKKALFLTMLTTYGVKQNEHYYGLIQNELKLHDLFV